MSIITDLSLKSGDSGSSSSSSFPSNNEQDTKIQSLANTIETTNTPAKARKTVKFVLSEEESNQAIIKEGEEDNKVKEVGKKSHLYRDTTIAQEKKVPPEIVLKVDNSKAESRPIPSSKGLLSKEKSGDLLVSDKKSLDDHKVKDRFYEILERSMKKAGKNNTTPLEKSFMRGSTLTNVAEYMAKRGKYKNQVSRDDIGEIFDFSSLLSNYKNERNDEKLEHAFDEYFQNQLAAEKKLNKKASLAPSTPQPVHPKANLPRKTEEEMENKISSVISSLEAGKVAKKSDLLKGQDYEALSNSDKKNHPAAAIRFKAKADQGCYISQYTLARHYQFGRGVEKDLKQAAYYFALAAEQGFAEAQYELSKCFRDGRGVEKDLNTANMLFELAFKQDYPPALHDQGCNYLNQEEAFMKAFRCFESAANKGYAEAQIRLGDLYRNKFQNNEKSALYYELAAKQGNAQAQYIAGENFLDGYFGFERNPKKGEEFLKLAADQGHSQAQFSLGSEYQKGRNINRDTNKANYYLTLAAMQGHFQANQWLTAIKNEQKQRDAEPTDSYDY